MKHKIRELWRAAREDSSKLRPLIGAAMVIVQPLMLNAISLPVTAFIIASLGPLDYGYWSLALVFTQTATMFTNVGLRNLLIRSIAREPERAQAEVAGHLALRVSFALIAGLFAIAVAIGFGYPRIVVSCTAILALGMVFTALGNVTADLLQATQRLPWLASINMGAGLLLTAASAVAVSLGTGPGGLALSYLIGPAVTALASAYLIRRHMFTLKFDFRPSRAWELLKHSRHLGVSQVASIFGHQSENFLVPKLVGISEYGVFAAGTLLPQRLMIVSDGLNSAFFPILAGKFHNQSPDAIATLRRFGILVFVASVPVAALLTGLAEPIARLLFKENWHNCAAVLRIASWALPLMGFESSMGYVLAAAGREADEARIALIRATAAVGLSAYLVSAYGIRGACAALCIKGVLGILLRVPILVRTVRTRTPLTEPLPVA